MPVTSYSSKRSVYAQYNIQRYFKENSTLHQYLVMKTQDMISNEKNYYDLGTISCALRATIIKQKLYDHNNTSCFIADADLEKAINRKFFHLTEINDIVLEHLYPLRNTPMNPLRPMYKEMFDPIEREMPECFQHPPYDHYRVNEELLQVIRMNMNTSQTKIIYRYREIVEQILIYIYDNHIKFFKHGTFSLAHIENDLLGKVFNVRLLHRGHIEPFINKQITCTRQRTC